MPSEKKPTSSDHGVSPRESSHPASDPLPSCLLPLWVSPERATTPSFNTPRSAEHSSSSSSPVDLTVPPRVLLNPLCRQDCIPGQYDPRSLAAELQRSDSASDSTAPSSPFRQLSPTLPELPHPPSPVLEPRQELLESSSTTPVFTPIRPDSPGPPFYMMNAFPLGQLRFSGNSVDGNPSRYLNHVKASVAVMRVDPAMNDVVALQVFRSGLVGPAARWFEDIETESDEKSWDDIQNAFKEKFRNGDPAVESALIAEAHGFGREPGESLSNLLKRASKLYHQLRAPHRKTMLTGLVLRMNDGEKDRRLQERVQDRLYADQKWGKSVAGDHLTYNDVHDMIWECRSSTTEKLTRNEEDYMTTSGMDPIRLMMRNQESISDLTQLMKETNILTSKRMDKMEHAPYQNYTARTANNRPPMNPPPQTTNNNPRTGTRAEDVELWWCFKCGDWGHMGYNCPLGRNFDQGEYDRRQQEWFANRDAMKQKRMEELARPSSIPAAKTMVWDGAADTRPPRGYHPTPFSGQPSDTLYRWSQKGLTRLDSTSDMRDDLQVPLDGTDELRQAVVRAARRDEPKEPKQTIPPRKPGRVEKQKEPVRPTDENVLRELEVQAREELQHRRTEYQPPRVDEDMEDVEQMPSVRDTIVVSSPTASMSEAEFQSLLPLIRPHLERMGRPSQESSGEEARERRPRHVLEKIRATEEYNLPTFELGQHLRDTPITLSVLQLLQIAASVRQQLSRLMQCRKKIRGNRAKEMVTSLVMPFKELMTADMREDLEDSLSRHDTEEDRCLQLGSVNRIEHPIVFADTAASADSVANTLGFIEGHVEGMRCSAIMLDGGSSVDLINKMYVERHGIPILAMPKAGEIRLANDSIQHVGFCAYIRVVVGGILATVKAYVLGDHDDWDILLGRPWLRRMRAMEDHYDEKLVVKGMKGHSQTIPIYPTPGLFEPDRKTMTREPVRPKPMRRLDEEDEIIFVDDDLPILEEVEDLLNELGEVIYSGAGQSYPASKN
ncbi:hypothetical protein FDECE_1512 [Fusarium decemcellulare]|nr:hypothetical protein FDECE_1512 [Fusarium decemcellulare]